MNRLRIYSAQAQSWLARAVQPLLHRLDKAVQSTKSNEDPEIRRQSRILNRVLMVIVPMALLGVITQLVLLPAEDLSIPGMVSSVVMGFAAALLIYFVNRWTHNFRLVSYIVVVVGSIVILTNAIMSTPPHLEIVLLVLLPLCGTLLFSLWETVLLCILNLVMLLTFIVLMGDMSVDVIKDLLIDIALIQLFIVFVAHQRNRLETERQQLALSAANHKLLTSLINGLSHDFRTPLSIVNTTAYLLARTDDPQAREERLEQIMEQVDRLSKMLDDILTLSRLDAVPDPTLTPVDVTLLLETLAQEFQYRLSVKNLHLTMDLMPDAPPVLAGRANLHRALLKILENAVQYTPTEGAVTLRTRQANDTLVIEVIDTGIGISQADLPSIFESFYRADQSRSTDAGSTGLGLSIARRIVEMYRGKIEVESVPDQGSTFRILLPADVSNSARRA